MYTYKAEYEDENIEVFIADSDDEAIEISFNYESEHGCLFNVTLINDNYDEIRTIF